MGRQRAALETKADWLAQASDCWRAAGDPTTIMDCCQLAESPSSLLFSSRCRLGTMWPARVVGALVSNSKLTNSVAWLKLAGRARPQLTAHNTRLASQVASSKSPVGPFCLTDAGPSDCGQGCPEECLWFGMGPLQWGQTVADNAR